ncbi:MAG TPA: type II toxin-antitoxin system VapC family toxin [Longimicrobium sp.]|jgi:ribonuclease VapC
MIVDSSAAIAIILDEDGSEHLAKLLMLEKQVGIGTPSLTETGMVLSRRLGLDNDWETLIAEFRDTFRVAEIPFLATHWMVAVQAFDEFGKGRHPAKLNFGDCLSYAVARVENRPLLFVGNDFGMTDIWKA